MKTPKEQSKQARHGRQFNTWLSDQLRADFEKELAGTGKKGCGLIREAIDYYLANGGHAAYKRWWLMREISLMNGDGPVAKVEVK